MHYRYSDSGDTEQCVLHSPDLYHQFPQNGQLWRLSNDKQGNHTLVTKPQHILPQQSTANMMREIPFLSNSVITTPRQIEFSSDGLHTVQTPKRGAGILNILLHVSSVRQRKSSAVNRRILRCFLNVRVLFHVLHSCWNSTNCAVCVDDCEPIIGIGIGNVY